MADSVIRSTILFSNILSCIF